MLHSDCQSNSIRTLLWPTLSIAFHSLSLRHFMFRLFVLSIFFDFFSADSATRSPIQPVGWSSCSRSTGPRNSFCSASQSSSAQLTQTTLPSSYRTIRIRSVCSHSCKSLGRRLQTGSTAITHTSQSSFNSTIFLFFFVFVQCCLSVHHRFRSDQHQSFSTALPKFRLHYPFAIYASLSSILFSIISSLSSIDRDFVGRSALFHPSTKQIHVFSSFVRSALFCTN